MGHYCFVVVAVQGHCSPKDTIACLCYCFEIVPAFWLGDILIFYPYEILCSTQYRLVFIGSGLGCGFYVL